MKTRALHMLSGQMESIIALRQCVSLGIIQMVGLLRTNHTAVVQTVRLRVPNTSET